MAEQGCETCIYTFPYWFWTCEDLKNKVLPLNWKENSLRVYAPFRMGSLYDMAIYQHTGGPIPALNGSKKTNDYINIKPPIPFPHLDGNTVSMVMEGQTNIQKLTDPYPANSIRVDYIKTERSFDDEVFLDCLVEWLRIKTGLYWIGKIMPSTYRFNKLKFKSNIKGEQSSNGNVSTNFFTLSGNEKSVCTEIWKLSLIESIQEKKPPLYLSIINDAKFMHFAKNYRRAVLDSAIACEEALIFFASEYHDWKYPSKQFKINKYFPGNNLTHHLDRYSKDFFGISLKEDNQELYELINQLWLARHTTAHSGKALIRDIGTARDVTEEDSIQFIDGVLELIGWLQKISKPK